jgi:hypothetical protein
VPRPELALWRDADHVHFDFLRGRRKPPRGVDVLGAM